VTQGALASEMGPLQAINAILADQRTLRRLRLTCGLIMFTYVTFHLVNHALGNIGWEAMQAGVFYAALVWRSLPGTVLLYGAVTLHFLLALLVLYRRRSFRMGFGEATRLILGFSILPLIIHHFVAQRYVYSVHDVHRGYDAVLYFDFHLNPVNASRQVLVLIVAFAHGAMGLHYWLRLKPGYRRAAPLLLSACVLLPTLALLGVAQGERQIAALADSDPAWVAALTASAHLADQPLFAEQWRVELLLYAIYCGGLLLVVAARVLRAFADHRGRSIRVTYPDGRVVRVPKGFAVLDASRFAGIPHASVCGGRGRCSTCRIRVLHGSEGLPPPAPSEAALLARFHAGPTIRLACQLRPQDDVTVLPLLPPDISPDDPRRRQASGDMERFVAIMFVDIRQSTALVEKRLPYDVIFILNHFFEAVGGAVSDAGGMPNQFIGDGMLAIFGLEREPREACRQALAAARLIGERLDEMNRLLAEELPQPISIGIGLHAGEVIVGELGYRDRLLTTAIGDCVNVASRLQELTKEYACQMVVSDIVFDQAELPVAGLPHHEIRVRGRDALLTVRTVSGVAELAA